MWPSGPHHLTISEELCGGSCWSPWERWLLLGGELGKRGERVCRDVKPREWEANSAEFSTSLHGMKWKKAFLLCFSHIQKTFLFFFFVPHPQGRPCDAALLLLQTCCLPQSCKSLASVPNSCCFVNQLNAATWREVITSFEARREDNTRTHWVYLSTAVLINGINAGACLLTLCKHCNLMLPVVFFFPGHLCLFQLLSWPVTV